MSNNLIPCCSLEPHFHGYLPRVRSAKPRVPCMIVLHFNSCPLSVVSYPLKHLIAVIRVQECAGCIMPCPASCGRTRVPAYVMRYVGVIDQHCLNRCEWQLRLVDIPPNATCQITVQI